MLFTPEGLDILEDIDNIAVLLYDVNQLISIQSLWQTDVQNVEKDPLWSPSEFYFAVIIIQQANPVATPIYNGL